MLWIIASIIIIFILFCLNIFFNQEKFIFFPEKLASDFQYNYKIPFDEINYTPDKKTIINALLFKSEDTKGIVIYFHGNAGSLRNWGNVADLFISLGYDVLIYDYRGFGKSTGKISEKTLYNDAQYIYNRIKQKYKESDIIIYGRSIGTGIATYIASNNHPCKLILETPFYNMNDLANKFYPWVPKFLLRFKFATNEYITKVKCPVYIFHGTNDEIIYYGSSLKLKKLFKYGDELFTIKGGYHNNLELFEEYHIKLNVVFSNEEKFECN
ncbi:MAG: lysophospholipase [Bacteroidales bacterium]|nr:lysophospholipase [Bacteroidales bacterium]